jgi:CRP/FNR family cyclic AMP-dependent transcriptional regulator
MSRTSFQAGDIIFSKGEESKFVYFILEGEVVFIETGRRAVKGRLIGDVGVFTPDRRRTLSARCETNVDALFISSDELKQLYFQNPQFGFYLVQLLVGSMSGHIKALEERIDLLQAPNRTGV